jgi:hypothetical protein
MQRSRPRKRWLIALVVLLLVAGSVAYNWTLLTHQVLISSKLRILWNRRMQDGPFTYWWGDLVRTVEVRGNVAYVGLGTRLAVVDLTDPAKPTMLQALDLYGIVHGLALRDNHLFCAHGASGMSIFDVSDPVHPVKMSQVAFAGYGMHVAPLPKNLLLFSDEAGGLEILDVKNPASMIPVRHVDSGWANAARVFGNIAYVLDGYEGVVVYDVSSPENPVRLTTVPIQLPPDVFQIDPPPIWLELQDGYAYVSNGPDGMQVLDVHDPAKAKVVAHLPLEGYSYTVAVRGNRVYMANRDTGLVVIDIADPLTPRVLRTIPTKGNACDIILRGNRGYLSEGASGFGIWDFSDPDIPREIGYFHVTSRTRGVTLRGDRLVTADAGDGIRIFDATDRQQPRLIGSMDTPGLARKVAIDGDTLYVVDVLGGFEKVDASKPDHPKIVRTFNLEDHPWGISRDGDFLYCAMGSHGFSIFDTRKDPPEQLFNSYDYDRETGARGTVDAERARGPGDGYTIEATKAGDLAFSGDLLIGLTIYDVKDPRAATRLGHYGGPSPDDPINLIRRGGATTVPGVFVDGKRAYLAAYDRGLDVINLDDPTKPVREGHLGVAGHSYGVWKDKERICLTTYEGDLFLIDATNPAQPREQQRLSFKGQLTDVICENQTAYVAAGTEGLVVVNFDTGQHTAFPVH